MDDLQFQPVTGFTPQEKGLLQYHRDNLTGGTYLEKGDDISTVYITGVTGPDGRIYNIPGYWSGKLVEPEEAAEMAQQYGWHQFPSYSSSKEADAAAERLHKIIDADTQMFRRWRGR